MTVKAGGPLEPYNVTVISAYGVGIAAEVSFE
jgi:hypothetical protein